MFIYLAAVGHGGGDAQTIWNAIKASDEQFGVCNLIDGGMAASDKNNSSDGGRE
jgi:hypothetical protein